jgi:hypothetical protein
MEKHVSVLVLIVLLSSTLSLPNQEPPSYDETRDELSTDATRIEISPNPHSVRDLGAPIIAEGEEGQRGPWADSAIGTYTTSGLLLDSEIPSSMMGSRPDLMMVLVSPETGLWDARVGILEAANVAVRTTIPPSGFLIQGTS